ncbi:1-phosphatidylinositol phosphodiesterase [Ceratocystis platani]|uniref:1-phosphatidylinositol phosphodiesterase n=1 Tax=Ceratocystis fimbriata f. sp. platani TaxID=88771 RepID=A0A0F8CZF6_CERFI|nr:1-phosphatidylinositol phosphodiesterase [Ceratocystis platani]
MRFSLFAAWASLGLGYAATHNKYSDDWSFDLDSAENPAWMSGLDDNVPLSMLSIPGTHNSVTDRFGEYNTQSQNVPLETQLISGIRYFDISCRDLFFNLMVYHGSSSTGYDLREVLNTIFNFLDKHPRETVILRIQKGKFTERSDTFVQHLERLLDPETHLGDRAVKRIFSKGDAGITAIPTLGEVRGKVFILQDFKTRVPGRYGLPWRSSAMSVYNFKLILKAFLVELKWHAVKGFIELIPSRGSEKLCITHTSISVGAKPIEIAAGSEGKAGMNRYLGEYLSSKNKAPNGVTERVGIIAMDFPGKSLIKQILKLNKVHQVTPPAGLPGRPS